MKRCILIVILIIGSLNSIYSREKDIVFAEIFYDTSLYDDATINPHHNGEYVKIQNISNHSVDISSWTIKLSSEIRVATFNFPKNTILPSNGIANVCYRFNTDFVFNDLFPYWKSDGSHLLFYHHNFFLSNKGNTLFIYDNNMQYVDKIIYGKDGLYADYGEGGNINICYSIQRSLVFLDDVDNSYIKSEYAKKSVNPMITNIKTISPAPVPSYRWDTPTSCNTGSNDQNYITRSVLRVPYNKAKVNITTNNAIMSTQYYDGFGRKIQTVSQGVAGSSDDLVDYIEYNNRGKASKQWLAVIGNGYGQFTPKTDVRNKSEEFYNGDKYAFSEVFYENSVINRPIESKAPGSVWHNATGITTEYRLNDMDGQLACMNYCVDHSTGNLKKDGVYPTGQLYVMCSNDEDGGTTLKFENKNDSTILVRQMNDNFIDTYYIYDRFGNLCYVLPPMAVDHYNAQANGIISDDEDVMQKYAYIYKYDYRNRCISKKLPGAASLYMVYDKCDLLTYTQDGNQRMKKEWSYFAYDYLGRIVYSGVKIDVASTHASLQDVMKSKSPRFSYNGGMLYGYNSLEANVTKNSVNIVNYYDDYKFLELYPTQKSELSYMAKSGFGEKNVGHSSYNPDKGLLTGSLRKVLDNSGKDILKAVYYDDRGQVVQSRETNHLSGYEKKYYSYSFTGKTLLYRHENSTSKVSSSEEYAYTYDDVDRLLTTKHGRFDKEKITLSSNSYNDLGQLSNYAINGKFGMGYSYNIRGWMTNVYCPKAGFEQHLNYESKSNGKRGCLDGNICEMSWNVKDLTFGANNITRSYEYTYDDMDRLLKADYKENKERSGASMNILCINPNYSTAYSYDLNGNMTSLLRKGITAKDGYDGGIYVYGTIDSLKYVLDGNQFKKIDDFVYSPNYRGAFDFSDLASAEREYLYDANGNVTQDMNKGIVAVEYNYLNLPKCITFKTGQVIEYVYDASGVKRSSIYKVQPETLFAPIEGVDASAATAESLVVQSRKDYCDSHIYNENDALTMVLVNSGYIANDKYHFYVTDYQGNNRVVMDQDGVVEQVNHYYPYGGTFSEGLAISSQPYKFGGKELDRVNGLDWSDFGARMLDIGVPSWGTIDPMADKYYSVSPYAYCAGNPVLYVDPTGEDVVILYYNSGLGHLGILIQNSDNSWSYYSVNGGDFSVSGINSEGRADDIGENNFDDPQEFMDSKYNTKGGNDPKINGYGYTEGYFIKTTKKQDTAIREKFVDVSKTLYMLFSNNCATAVQEALNAGGIKTSVSDQRTGFDFGDPLRDPIETNSIIPPAAYRAIIRNNPKGSSIKKEK